MIERRRIPAPPGVSQAEVEDDCREMRETVYMAIADYVDRAASPGRGRLSDEALAILLATHGLPVPVVLSEAMLWAGQGLPFEIIREG